MSQDNIVKLQCTETGEINYRVHKNTKVHKGRLELKKYSPKAGKHTLHKETK